MPYYCTVPRCTSMAGKAKNVSFHQFPRDEELARLWNDILKRGKPYTKYSKVCSLHFKAEDYTITSVGKNKGQWRTLRKDAVPSQNLPSETPAPYSRKQWDSWSQNSGPPVMDPTIHHQVAQAIYMQTMLAMQAAGTTEPLHQNGPSLAPDLPHSSNQEDILKGKHTNTDATSYKCTDCTKCFKDPDVFILHKRSHSKELKSNGVEKENFNMNLTLRSNPILANLLKTNNDAFDPSMVTMENLLMTALAANIDYLRNYTNKDGEREYDGVNRDMNQSRNDVNNAIGDLNRLKSELSHRSVELHPRNDLDQMKCDRNAIGNLNHVRNDVSSTVNHPRGEINVSRSDTSYINKDNHSNDPDNLGDSNATSLLNHVSGPLSYAIDFTSKEINDKSRTYGNYYKERCFSSDYETNEKRNDNFNENGLNHCDNDTNESLDSNSLVIDESV